MAGATLFLLPAMHGEAAAHAQDSPSAGPAYFGQPSPGVNPALFAPVRFRNPGEYHSPPVFSPGGREVWWTLAAVLLPSAVLVGTTIRDCRPPCVMNVYSLSGRCHQPPPGANLPGGNP
jgi:hypothetical protein